MNPPQGTPHDNSGLTLVTARAAVDRHFRRQLLQDPHHAIRTAFGIELPQGLRLKFVEKGQDIDMLVVLPDLVDDAEPLSLDELDAVLGGTGRVVLVCGTGQERRVRFPV
ncbi:MAG TPA: hypothetical protein VHG28_23140 [Longimicrobiaceae bacterium]|nr:hypothetical protein [Longimicrobiaceae bacterium]